MSRALKYTALAAGIAALMGALALATCALVLTHAPTSNHAIEGADRD